jgi:hypothetical protein
MKKITDNQVKQVSGGRSYAAKQAEKKVYEYTHSPNPSKLPANKQITFTDILDMWLG